MLTPNTVQRLWAVIESTQVNTLLQFDDATLVQLLLKQLTQKQVLDAQTTYTLGTYIRSKLPLIRDTADSRVSQRHNSH